MERLAIYLALHGAIVLTISLVAGLLLHKAIRLGRPLAAWHLAHAGVSSRGVMLMPWQRSPRGSRSSRLSFRPSSGSFSRSSGPRRPPWSSLQRRANEV